MTEIEKMVEENKNLVFYTIARYFPDYKTDEDVIQIGMIALWYACTRYDQNKGIFSSYCVRQIWREIGKHFNHFNRCGRDAHVYSLDSPIDDENGKQTWIDLACGDVDVDFIDTEAISKHLKPKHKKLIRSYLDGNNYEKTAKLLGVSCNSITKWTKEIKEIILKYA